MQKQRQVALQVSRDQEILPHVLVALLAQPLRDFRMREQKANLIRRAFHGVRQQPGVFVNHLRGNAPTAEATTGFFFHSASATVSPKPSRRLF